MLYDLSNILDRERFKRRANDLFKKQCVVDLTERKCKRTSSQNRYLHLILGYYAIETGNTLEYVKREYFKRLCNPDIFRVTTEDRWLGVITYYRSSADLTTKEMTDAIERFRNWSSGTCGIYLPSSDEYPFLQSLEVELDKHKQYL